MYKFKYLVFKEKPYNYGVTVAQLDVTHLTKKEIKVEWDKLVKTDFPEAQFASSLTETKKEMRVFNNRVVAV